MNRIHKREIERMAKENEMAFLHHGDSIYEIIFNDRYLAASQKIINA